MSHPFCRLSVTFVYSLLLGISSIACSADPKSYQVTFSGAFDPDGGAVRASIEVVQSHGGLISLNFAAPPERFWDFTGSGKIDRQGDRLVWTVPESGGVLNYNVRVDHERKSGGHDALMTSRWALMRLGDMFPAAKVRSIKGVTSRSEFRLTGPEGWGFETRYGSVTSEARPIRESDRRFDRPTGWMLAGELGIRREWIAQRKVVIAAPRGSKFPRLPTLAFLNWTLPDLVKVFPGFPDQLLIVSARNGMWRGALSGPASLYLHGDRPLISENSTSPLLHELVHVATGMSAEPTDDWIVEGLAEYYGLEILRRSGGLSDARFERALNTLEAWVKREKGQLRGPSAGADTARAVLLFHELANELHEAGTSLDQLVANLVKNVVENGKSVSQRQLNAQVEQLLGRGSRVLTTALAGTQ